MDLTKLTDADLAALEAGDIGKVSDAGLAVLVGGDAQEAPAAPAPEAARPSMVANPRTGLSTDPRDATAGAVAMSRFGIPLAGATGGLPGVAASGLGEKLAQTIEGSDRPGDVAQAMVMGGVPLGGARGVWAGIKEALKLGTAGAIGKQAQSLGNEGQMASGTDTGIAAALPAILGMLGRGAGRATGAATGNVAPEELARVQAARLNNANKDAVLATMQGQGARVVPSSVNPSMKNKILESITGIQNLEAGLARENQPLFNAIGRKEASIPADAPINETTLEAARNAIGNESYGPVRASGAGDLLDQWRSAATKLKEAEAKMEGGKYTVERGAAVDAEQAAMDRASAAIDAAGAGNPELMAQLQAAKQAFGKNFDVDRAVLSGTDEVRPAVLSALLERRGEAGLSGGLRDIAQFNNAFGRSAKNPNNLATAPGAASAGAAMVAGGGDPVTTPAIIGIVPMIREAIRNKLVSQEYQAANAVRNYTPDTSANPEVTAAIQRLMLQLEAARQRQ